MLEINPLVRIGRGPIETELRITIGDLELGSQPVPAGDLAVLTFELPRPLPLGAVLEVDLRCDWFRPSDTPGVEDGRTLGVRVAEVWLDS